ncbi:MAG TPA: heme-binding domain-containing protein [Bacteroidia bacterium]|nr:heme-binding domain-containing protein [Bacteroidia bacterium]
MRKHLTLKKISLTILILLVLIQAFRIDKTNPPIDPARDFLAISGASSEVSAILKTSCYDCHSHNSVYPWYTNIAPVSWWIKNHINEGRRHLNFSEWGQYSAKKADHKLEECVEMIQEGEMPMSSYTLVHKGTALSDEQKLLLVNWFNSLRTNKDEEAHEEEH